jgi:pyridoxine 5-phosphate synthase
MVSLFIDPDQKQIEVSKEEIGADCIEIHTGSFSEAKNLAQEKNELEKIIAAVEVASRLELGINVGHGLDYHNIKKIISIKEIEDFSIGHSIVARAIMVGMDRAVKEMLALING